MKSDNTRTGDTAISLSPADADALARLLASHEENLMERVLEYATLRNYTKYTSTLKEAWRLSIEGLTTAFLGSLDTSPGVPELGPDEDYAGDPVSRFGMDEAQKHRARGVSLSMFLGLMKYYRQSYMDLIEGETEFTDPPGVRLYIERCFDRLEIAFCSEWSGLSAEKQIHELARANLHLANEKNKYLTLFESLSTPVILTDPQGAVVALNHAANRLFNGNEVPGARYYSVEERDPERLAWLEEDIDSFLTLDREIQFMEKTYGDGQGAKQFDIKMQRMLDVSHKFQGLTVILNDVTERKRVEALLRRSQGNLEVKVKERTRALTHEITERKRIEQQIREQATHDVLTGLPNRMLFMDRLVQAINSSKREDGQVALLFIDLDRFKVINDSLGHMLGDQLLKQVALRLVRCIRDSDTVARLGGDEFTAILPGLHSANHAALVADKILKRLAESINVSGHEISVGGSIGITVYPSDAVDAEELLRNADMAMYKAKENGRNRYQFFTQEMNEQAHSRMLMEQDLVLAVERREFLLNYQPIVDLSTGAVAGAEALVRWQHPDKGLIRPDLFIAAAEETGLIEPLGEWVLQSAAEQAVQWAEEGMDAVRIAVNVSPRQIQLGLSPRRIRELLERTGLPPWRLTLEITESLLMEDRSTTLEWTRAVKALGVRLAIDDFGTGYSSLSYLKRFPIDLVKIDRSFVCELDRDPGAEAMVEAILSIAGKLGLQTTAEGVESQAQLERLCALGCRYVQGYLLSPPKALKELKVFVKKWRQGPICFTEPDTDTRSGRRLSGGEPTSQGDETT